MGSTPGETEPSGTHIQPFVPARSSVIFPDASMSMTAACAEISAGAAEVALVIFPSGVVGAAAGAVAAGVESAAGASVVAESSAGCPQAARTRPKATVGRRCLNMVTPRWFGGYAAPAGRYPAGGSA